MDLLSTIRKSGSRGGVNFSWDDVSTSAHRENYLGHSLKAPVGRWQKGRDLNWYAKAGDGSAEHGDETAEERSARERKEEIRRVKEAEEDALNRALGLPVPDRSASGGVSSGANNVGLGEVRRVVGEVGVGVGVEGGEGKGFGEFVGKLEGVEGGREVMRGNNDGEGGLVRGEKRRRDDRDGERRHRRRERDEKRPGDDRRDRGRSRSPGHQRRRRDHRDRSRSRSPPRKDKSREQRERSRSPGQTRRQDYRDRNRDGHERRRRSRSGGRREERRYRERTPDGERKRGRDKSSERPGRKRDTYDRRRSP